MSDTSQPTKKPYRVIERPWQEGFLDTVIRVIDPDDRPVTASIRSAVEARIIVDALNEAVRSGRLK